MIAHSMIPGLRAAVVAAASVRDEDRDDIVAILDSIERPDSWHAAFI